MQYNCIYPFSNSFYTISIKNEGNIKAENLNLIENIQKETTFIKNSLFINGVNKTVNDLNNPYPLGTLEKNMELSIVFKVIVHSIPSSNIVQNQAQIDFEYKLNNSPEYKNESIKSNMVSTDVKNANLLLTKTVDKNIASIFDTLNYTVDFKNVGNVPALNVIFKDILPKEVIFNPNIDKVYFNNKVLKDANPNLGIQLNQPINCNEKYTLSFDVTIVDSPSKIENFCTSKYDYMVLNNVSKLATSNTVSTKLLLTSNIKAHISADKQYADLEDTLTYTIVIENIGSLNLINLKIKNKIPQQIKMYPMK